MAPSDSPLFSGRNLGEVLRGLERQLQVEIDGVNGDALLNTSVDDLCGYLEEKYAVAVPVLDKDGITQDHSEAQIDVSRDRMRNVPNRRRPAYVTGTRITFYVPFQGDPAMFNCTPSTYTSVFPYARIVGKELLLTHESTEQSHAAAKSYLDHNLGQIERWLGWIRGDVSRHNASLRQLARTRVEARRDKLLRDRNMVEAIGIPLRKRGDAPRTYDPRDAPTRADRHHFT